MISTFRLRGIGFWFAWDDLSDAYLKRINGFRVEKSYMDKDAEKFFEMVAPSRKICQGKTIILWWCLIMGITTINMVIGDMRTLFYK